MRLVRTRRARASERITAHVSRERRGFLGALMVSYGGKRVRARMEADDGTEDGIKRGRTLRGGS
jgi:hypothetical protein